MQAVRINASFAIERFFFDVSSANLMSLSSFSDLILCLLPGIIMFLKSIIHHSQKKSPPSNTDAKDHLIVFLLFISICFCISTIESELFSVAYPLYIPNPLRIILEKATAGKPIITNKGGMDFSPSDPSSMFELIDAIIVYECYIRTAAVKSNICLWREYIFLVLSPIQIPALPVVYSGDTYEGIYKPTWRHPTSTVMPVTWKGLEDGLETAETSIDYQTLFAVEPGSSRLEPALPFTEQMASS